MAFSFAWLRNVNTSSITFLIGFQISFLSHTETLAHMCFGIQAFAFTGHFRGNALPLAFIIGGILLDAPISTFFRIFLRTLTLARHTFVYAVFSTFNLMF